jgi:hypothetical protein
MSSLIGTTKSFASLSSTLLARKGQARPAMRPQGFSGFGNVSEVIDDLGWNDMGHAESAAPPPPLASVPPVLRQREALLEEFEAPVEAVAVEAAPAVPAAVVSTPVAAPAKPRAAVGSKPKAAFTLRLDHDRHLRLRLASALGNRSAQQIVTQALDDYLHALPEFEALAQQAASRGETDLGRGN